MAKEKKKGLLKKIFGCGSDYCGAELKKTEEKTRPEQDKNEVDTTTEKREKPA